MPLTASDPVVAPPLHGLWRIAPSLALTEVIAQSGFDFQILDCEHGAYDFATLHADILACERHGCAPWVRVSGTSKVEVQRCLDLGARAIVFPQLATYDDFVAAGAMLDHAPAGVRGFNPFVRAYGHGAATPPSRLWCVPIIETLAAVEQLDAILALPRIDAIYIGSYDLSAQLGVTGQMDAPKLTQVVDRILAGCRRALKPVGLMVLSESAARQQAGRGVQILVHGIDAHCIRQSMTAITAPLREPVLPSAAAQSV